MCIRDRSAFWSCYTLGFFIRLPLVLWAGIGAAVERTVSYTHLDVYKRQVLYSIFKTGLDGETAKIKNLRQAERYLPDNIYTALEDFRKSEWTTKILGEDVKGRYADLKQAAADRLSLIHI